MTAAQLGGHLIRLRHGIGLLELDFAGGAAIFAATDRGVTHARALKKSA
jgi:hypothetical protein